MTWSITWITYSRCFIFIYKTRLAARFDYISTAVIAAVAKLDPQNGIAPSSHVVLVTCVKYLYWPNFGTACCTFYRSIICTAFYIPAKYW